MKALLFILMVFAVQSCKINQYKNKEREGKWVFEDSISRSVGRFSEGFEVGTWKYFENKNLMTKKKYKDSICQVVGYHPNGKIQSKGVSKLVKTAQYLHWYLDGEWIFYDENGKEIGIKKYKKGKEISTTIIYK